MPKLTRKFPTKQKTTTTNGRREYSKLLQREIRAKKKAKSKELLSILASLDLTATQKIEQLTKLFGIEQT